MTEQRSNESLAVTIGEDGAIVVVGDIDIAGGPLVESVISDLTAGTPIVIDLAGVSFIDSSGLRSLLGASRRAKQDGSMVVLRSVGPEVARLLQITATTDQFTIDSHRG